MYKNYLHIWYLYKMLNFEKLADRYPFKYTFVEASTFYNKEF